jgi:hypothetical protein
MALVVKDRVQETSTTTGTGTITLAGAVSGFQSFSVIGNANTTYYAIVLGTEFEVGLGTYTSSGTTLSRDTVLESSNSGSLVNFSAGTKNVFVTYPAEKGLYLDASGNAIALGTPASATLTNATGLPISTGVSGLGTNVATFLATPTSANLAAALTDETGTGANVFATSPTLTTPILGTPSSGTLTSCTGLPLTTGVTGTLPVANGGTNQTSYTNGQLLIGNTTGNTLAKATLTAGTGISVTNGAGSITINNSAPSIAWQSVQTGNFNATAGSGYPVNTTSSAITVTLPASPAAGDAITLTDYASKWATNNVTVALNGNKLNSVSASAILSTNRQSISLVYIDATQGWISYNGFLDSLPSQTITATYLIVAGGGSGGGGYGGGGGAGGLLAGSVTLTSGTVYTVTVGAGGAAAPGNNGTGNNGTNSSFTGLTTAIGGGRGGPGEASGSSGGSGGGAGGSGGTSFSAGTGTSGQGNAGGINFIQGSVGPAGGGGGAGAVGTAATSSQGGAGGSGSANSITGSSITYAGGGGGGTISGTGGAAGSGGGGTGGAGATGGTAGTANTGGGGGGGGGYAQPSGAGGSGVVIISLLTANYSGTTTGSPTVTTSGSNTILSFTASGSYTA